MKLTLKNGIPLDVDREKILEIGPHVSGGSFIKVGSQTYLVTEKVETILKMKEIDK
jgi:hypothetical protein